MTDDQKEQLAEVAITALSEGLLHALKNDQQFHELRRSELSQLADQLDQLSRWSSEDSAIAGPSLAIDARKLPNIAGALRQLEDGTVTKIVERFAAALRKAQP